MDRIVANKEVKKQISDEDIEKIIHYFTGVLTTNFTPLGFLRVVIFYLNLCLHRDDKIIDESLESSAFEISTSSATTYVCWKKNDANNNLTECDDFEDKALEIPGSKLCPVNLFKKLLDHRNKKNNWLFQKPTEAKAEDFEWFEDEVANDIVKTFMKDISREAGLYQEYTMKDVWDADETLLRKLYPKLKWGIWRQPKTFSDPIHKHMTFPYLCCRIINTPEFQRLKYLKQLGLTNFVYPAASHNRFEHCLGTGHLAKEYIEILKKNQPELGITDKDVLCIIIAGLCHDLGHGPFSHTWERFIACAKLNDESIKKFKHEEMSIKIFDKIYTALQNEFEMEGLTDADITFIKEAILGKPLNGAGEFSKGANSSYLYQIVANKETKIDVDKFDYMLRDALLLNLGTSFDSDYIMKHTIVREIPGKQGRYLAYRDKLKPELDELFFTRARLHRTAYQHRVTMIIEVMMVDALLLADEHRKTSQQENRLLCKTHEDLESFITMTDAISERIAFWGSEGTQAQHLINMIFRRELYKIILSFKDGEYSREKINDLTSDLNVIEATINLTEGTPKDTPIEVCLVSKDGSSQIMELEQYINGCNTSYLLYKPSETEITEEKIDLSRFQKLQNEVCNRLK